MGRDVLSGKMVEGCNRGKERGIYQSSEEWAARNCWRWLGDEWRGKPPWMLYTVETIEYTD